MIKKKKISKKTVQLGERKILPKVSTTENKSKIDIKNEVGQVSTHFVDLRKKDKSETETPFFWLNAPKKSIWRQNFLERMKKMDKPEDLKDSDEIVPLLETKNESDFVEKESKKDIIQKEEVPQIVMKLVASNHTWAHQGWEKIETVLVGWTDKSLVRAFLLFFLVCWMIILPVKIITFNSGQKVFGEKIFNNSESSLDQESKIKNLEEDKRFLLIFQSQGINKGKIEGLSLVDVSAGKIKKVDNLGGDFETLNNN